MDNQKELKLASFSSKNGIYTIHLTEEAFNFLDEIKLNRAVGELRESRLSGGEYIPQDVTYSTILLDIKRKLKICHEKTKEEKIREREELIKKNGAEDFFSKV